jgi:hypothetical protein
VPELELRERPPSTLRNIDGGPPGGVGAGGPEHPPSTLRNIDGGPLGGARARGPGAQRLWSLPSGRAMNGCRNLGTNAQRVVRTHFTLTQVGHFR